LNFSEHLIQVLLSYGAYSQGRRQRKMSGGTKRKKLKHMAIIFVVYGIRNAA